MNGNRKCLKSLNTTSTRSVIFLPRNPQSYENLRITLQTSNDRFKKCAHLAANLLMYLYHQELNCVLFRRYASSSNV